MKIYTKTVCPKCMLLKSKLDNLGISYITINIDKDDSVRDYLLDRGLMAAPILELDGNFYTDMKEIDIAISKMSK